MSSGEEFGPFILRFSKSMYKPNPRMMFSKPPRTAPGERIKPHNCTHRLKSGFGFYKSFDYNAGLPVFGKIVLKKGSLAKSLRYHFFKTTELFPLASISEDSFVFSIKDTDRLNSLLSIIAHSRNRSFTASLSHLEDIDILSPEEKYSVLYKDSAPERFMIKLFSHSEGYDSVLNFFRYQLNVKDAELSEICGQKYISAKSSEIKHVIDTACTHTLVQSVCAEPEIYLYEQYIRHSELPLECIQKREINRSYPKAAIVDSGISDESLLREWELDRMSFVDEDDRNTRHGTFVCGRLLCKNEQFGGITYLNIEIIPSKKRLTLEDFENHMHLTLQKYHKTVKIYNISLGTNIPYGDVFSPAAAVLDGLQYRYDVLFIISAGNSFCMEPDEDKRLTSPAESVNSITVGSVSHTDTNLQKKNTPSLFTRHGPGPAGFVKPDVASFGGAHEKRFGKLRPVGVFSIGIKNEMAEDSGTSHAAPLITAAAANIYDRYSLAFKSTDMTKTIIIHYTFLNNEKRDTDIFTGYGITPENLADDSRNATFIHEGRTIAEGIVELPDIPLPEDMSEEGRATGEVVLTLTYKTATDINFPHFYCMYNLEASLGYYKNGKWMSILTSKHAAASLNTEKMDKNAVNERFKWQPTKVLRRELKNKKLPDYLSLRLITSKRDFYTKKPEISYAVAISFIHKEKNLYHSLRNMHRNKNVHFEHSSELWKTCG